MTADSFEIMKLWVPLKAHGADPFGSDWSVVIPFTDEATEEAWQKASQFAQEGWELIGAVPITGGFLSKYSSQSVSHTTGYVLLFKRRIQEEES